MIAFPGMLVEPAKQAGMKVPSDPDNFDVNEYPHFAVFCNVQLGRSLPFPTAHWENAYVVADIPESEINTILINDLLGKGFY